MNIKKINLKGNSMFPFMSDGAIVTYETGKTSLELGDIILFLENDEFVIHRVVKDKMVKGDRSVAFDSFSSRSYIGKVIGFEHNESKYSWSHHGPKLKKIIAFFSYYSSFNKVIRYPSQIFVYFFSVLDRYLCRR